MLTQAKSIWILLATVILGPSLARAEPPVPDYPFPWTIKTLREVYKAEGEHQHATTLDKAERYIERAVAVQKRLKRSRVVNCRVMDITVHQSNSLKAGKEPLLFCTGNQRRKAIAYWKAALPAAKERLTKLQERGPLQPVLKECRLGKVGHFLYRIRIVQILDDKNMLVSMAFGGVRKIVWIKGINTTSLADGDSFETDQALLIKGTRRYSTAAGSTNTAYVLLAFHPN